jgi:hypothetical protein
MQMIVGTVTSVEQIAARDKCSIRQVNMTISLAFLAPREAAIEGRLPRCIGITRLRDARFVDLIRRRSAKGNWMPLPRKKRPICVGRATAKANRVA